MLDQQVLEQVSHFKYLGTEITEQNSSSLDIKCRTAQALAAVGKLCQVWKSKHISISTNSD